MYRNYFPLMALGLFRQRAEAHVARQAHASNGNGHGAASVQADAGGERVGNGHASA
jgi:hypothetical protein